MSQENHSALLGLHNPSLAKSFGRMLKSKGYFVDVRIDLGGMLEAMDKQEYSILLMDGNLGTPGSTDIVPAVEVYKRVKPKVDEGLVKFMVISGNPDTVEALKEKGIPAMQNTYFSLSAFL